MYPADELTALSTFINEHRDYLMDAKGIDRERYMARLYAYNALLTYRNALAQAIEENWEIDWQLYFQFQMINNEMKAK